VAESAETGGAALTPPPVELRPAHHPVPLQIHERATDAGCYTFVAEVWTVDDSHPEITRQIRELAEPRYVPLQCRRVYLTPAGTETERTYHVIGKYIPHPSDGAEDEYIRLAYVPQGFPFPADRIQPLRTLWAPWEKGTVEYANATPPARVEIGPWLVEQMRALRKFQDVGIRIDGDKVMPADFVSDFKLSILEAESLRDQKLVEEARSEARYRMRHNWNQLKKAADEGRWSPEPPASVAFCDLGKKGA